jgi:plasmid replication initiation protein
MLGLLDSYKSYYLFKQRVIEQAKKELDEHCDITFDYREIRVGRKIEKIEFNIIRQPEVFNEAEVVQNGESKLITANEEEIVKALQDIGLTPSQIERAIKMYAEKLEELSALINDFSEKNRKGKIGNLPAYLWDVIKVDGVVNKNEGANSQKQEQEAELKAKREQLEKLVNEQNMIAAWKNEYEEAERVHNERLADEGMFKLSAFEEHVRKNMGLRTMLLKKGELNQQHSLFRYMLGAFVAETQDKGIADFPDWVKNLKGYHIIKDENSREDFKIASKQATLF